VWSRSHFPRVVTRRSTDAQQGSDHELSVTGTLGDDIFEGDDESKGKIDVYDLKELEGRTIVGA